MSEWIRYTDNDMPRGETPAATRFRQEGYMVAAKLYIIGVAAEYPTGLAPPPTPDEMMGLELLAMRRDPFIWRLSPRD